MARCKKPVIVGRAVVECWTQYTEDEHDVVRHASGLTCNVLRPVDFPDCTNGGLTGRVSRVTLIGPNVSGPVEPTDERPAVVLTPSLAPRYSREPFVVPFKRGEGAGPMMGGNFVTTSDSRFSEATRAISGGESYSALRVHDRWEQ